MKISNDSCVFYLVALLLFQLSALPVGGADKAPASRVAFQVVGRNQVVTQTSPNDGTAFVMGYLKEIDRIPGPLFSNPGNISELTAFFTFISDEYTFTTIDNANTRVRFRPAGTLIDLYIDSSLDQDYANPNTFSNGQLIATFRSGAALATKVGDVATQIASAELVSSQDFVFGGKKYNLKHIVKNGVTFILSGSATPVVIDEATVQLAFSGSAVSIGEGGGK